MTDAQLLLQINSLPKELQKEVFDFIERLKKKTKPSQRKKERTFGYAKGFFTLKENFDAPLEDFKEYSE